MSDLFIVVYDFSGQPCIAKREEGKGYQCVLALCGTQDPHAYAAILNTHPKAEEKLK